MDDSVLNRVVDAVISEINRMKKEQPEKKETVEYKTVTAEEKNVSTKEKEVSESEFSDPDMLAKMKRKTSARIGVGKAGPRVRTATMLSLRADHAAARDSAFFDVDENLLDKLGLFKVKTKCNDKNEYLTRPDLGRQFSDETLSELRSKCTMNPDVQIFASDGLSCKAIEANLGNVLPALTDGVKNMGLSVGTPFFVQYGRVASMDHIAECLGAKVTCILVGERPGLGSAESMSAYIAYDAKVGMPESNRTVVSNIYSGGITAVEAGAYIADIIKQIYDNKASGVNLKK